MKINLNRSIKPLPANMRIQPELIIGADYYVSLEEHAAWSCALEEIRECGPGPMKFVTIRVRGKSHWGREVRHSVYSDEIGWTPEEAVKHTPL